MSNGWLIHTLVFDLDDTLYAEREFVLGGFRAAGRWLEQEHGIRGLATEAAALFDQGVRGAVFDRVLPRLRREPDAAIIAGLVAAYRAHQPVLTLLPDAVDCLTWARGRLRLAMVTDGYCDVQQRKIETLGLDKVIICRILTDTLGRDFWKPHPAGFQRVMSELPGRPEGYLYVADNPRKDFIAPRALGWRTARIIRPGGEHAGYCCSVAEAAERDLASLLELRSFVEPSV